MDTRVKPAYDALCERTGQPVKVYIAPGVGYFVL
jgi:hypothetical protein